MNALLLQLPLFEGNEGVSPDLASYDFIVVNTSAGKDSQVMMDVVATAAADAGVSDRLVAVHADLGRVEWPGTRELAAEHAAHYGIRFEVVQAGGGDLLDRLEARGMWPDAARRWCTSDLKRGPIRTLFTRLAAEYRNAGGGAPCRILNCMGLRDAESPARRRRAAFRFDESASNGRRHIDEWLPIHGLSTAEVWERNTAAGTRHHPAYDLGMPRLSCSMCVLASRSALVRAAQLRPEIAAEYVRVEVRIGHRFRKDFSVAEIVAAAQAAPAGSAPVTEWVA
jgi:3'-phosphoadenosine 5'-phosphosulfate sulfotransferase (PAPS reductase)/FAD synthetase